TVRSVIGRERATREQRRPDRLEKARCDATVQDLRSIRSLGPPGDRVLPRVAAARERQLRGAANLLDARDRAQLFFESREECVHLVTGVVTRSGQIDTRRDDAIRIEAWIDLLETKQAPDEQRGADAQHQRERDLADHEALTPATHAPALTSAPAAFPECVLRGATTRPT